MRVLSGLLIPVGCKTNDGTVLIFFYLHMTLFQRIKRSVSLLLIFITASIISFSQTVIDIDSPAVAGTTTVIAGYHYKRSNWHNIFWGKHYRQEWSTAVRVKNFYLDTAVGGLTPLKESGSRQSRGLRLKNTQGKEFVLRSIDKDFGNGLGKKFKGTFMARVAKDQASTGHPYAALTIAAMIRPTGIYHTNPRIIFVPKQPALGEYNDGYGNQLYLFEERPDENQEDAPSFGRSGNVIGTEKLFEHIYEDNDNHVDQKAFAKARLFDMFIGDWGRHADQWRWAEFETGKETVYKPIPRDRDQAYTKFDGFWPWVATNTIGPGTFLENFDSHLDKVAKFNKPAYPLDKLFLNELSKQDWIMIAKELQASLTDEVIENGIRQMPAEIFAISGEKIISSLKSRRNELERYAEQYYNYLAQHVVLVGSQKNEFFDIHRVNGKETRVNIYKKTKDGEIKSDPYYSRVFHKYETSDIRIYSLEGNDKIRLSGGEGIRLTFIDPDKTDSFSLENKKKVSVSSGQRYEYDTVSRAKFDLSIRPLISPAEYDLFDEDPLQLFTRIGIKISAYVRFVPKPWQKDEYKNVHLVCMNYGFLRGTLAAAYVGRFRQTFGKWDLLVKARADLPAVENFFGAGNETVNETANNLSGKDIATTFYKTSSTRFYSAAGLYRDMGIHHVEFNPFYQYIEVRNSPDNFITTNSPDQSIFSARQFAGIEAGYQLRQVNDRVYPTRGFHFVLGGGYVQNIKDRSRSFAKASSSLSLYIPLSRAFTLAIRGGGAVMDGKADYYHLNTLGGNENLRGYPRERFFGKNSFYNNNELRWVFDTQNYFFTGRMGLLAFYDTGRVWQPGETSDKWHMGYGAGLILIPFNKVALTGTYGLSKETSDILLQAHIFF